MLTCVHVRMSTQAGQALGGSSALQQLPSSSSSGLALTGGAAASSSSAAAAASDPSYDAVTPEDLERAKKAAAGSSTGSCYCSLPGVAATTVYYKEKTLVMVRIGGSPVLFLLNRACILYTVLILVESAVVIVSKHSPCFALSSLVYYTLSLSLYM